MDRLRRFLEAGVTCFIDLTETMETPGYEQLLPFETPAGRRIEYLREPIIDHGVPSSRDVMARVLKMLDAALASGHVVYLHCRAGIGRSAMAAGCWLAERCGDGEQALRELRDLWQQAAQSHQYPSVPETSEQVRVVREWSTRTPARNAEVARATTTSDAEPVVQRMRGAWLGLALGDALGSARALRHPAGSALRWTQHTALALNLAHSLLATRRSDARDQIERYVRWLKQGECASTPGPQDSLATADVVKALASYQWRGLPMAGPHDPNDVSATSLPRVLGVVALCWADPAVAVARSAESARTTHQSPTILDACRLYGAMLTCALQGQPPEAWLARQPEPRPGFWSKPLRREVRALVDESSQGGRDATLGETGDVLHVLATIRRVALEAGSLDEALDAALRAGRRHAALYGALVGTLAGLRFGAEELTESMAQRLPDDGRSLLEVADRCVRMGGRMPGVRA
jgi:ADP-ribosylglycohydrolase